jgi:ABC-type anion transport system duplicated permease subunit
MSSESVCQVARSWVDVGRFHKRLVAKFMIFTASVWNILDTPSYFGFGTVSSENMAHVDGLLFAAAIFWLHISFDKCYQYYL